MTNQGKQQMLNEILNILSIIGMNCFLFSLLYFIFYGFFFLLLDFNINIESITFVVLISLLTLKCMIKIHKPHKT